MGSMVGTGDLATLGEAAGELMHDMIGLLTLVEGRTALLLTELRAGRAPVEEAEAALQECRDLKAMVADVVAVFSGSHTSSRFRPLEVTRSEIDRAIRISAPAEVGLQAWISVDTEVGGPASFYRRMLSNLLRNALRHADSQVNVTLAPAARNGRQGLLIAVENDGAEMPGEIRQRLFQVGSHGDHGGTGLGLASASWAAEQLGGAISNCDPEQLGGARFEIWLPTVHLRADQPAPPQVAGTLSGAHIVVIDDDPSILRVFTRVFERAGARVSAPLPDTDWQRALAGGEPDAILLDLNLGTTDGIGLWREIAARWPRLASRVIFVSGATGSEQAELATIATGRPVLSKALDIEQLVRAVEVEILLR
jgi:CheY-like chemotaxis protein